VSDFKVQVTSGVTGTTNEYPHPPSADLVLKQETNYTTSDFVRDLEKVTARTEQAPEHDPGSPRR
jgi:hypothetical protein